MKYLNLWTIVSLSFLSLSLWAGIEPRVIYNGSTGSIVSQEDILNEIQPGHVIVLSELHGLSIHHQNQIEFLKSLKAKGFNVSVGMEHLYYQQQDFLDQYLSGEIFENLFLKAMNWSEGLSFDFYRYQVNFPLTAGGTTLALKAPRALTRKVAIEGLESLTEEERGLLPPEFEIGNDKYFERFQKAAGGHGQVDPDSMRKYFEAHSIWDEAMAWKTREYMKANPSQVFVIIVGDFHASYFGGLPSRLSVRGQEKLTVISQVNINGLKSGEAEEEVYPSKEYGPRGDYVWVSDEVFN